MNMIQVIKDVHQYFDREFGLVEVKQSVELVMFQHDLTRHDDLPEEIVDETIKSMAGRRTIYKSQDDKMIVAVRDRREFPDYKNVQVVSLVRNLLNENGINWEGCVAIGEVLQDAIENADYLSDDVGRTWAMSFVPSNDVNPK